MEKTLHPFYSLALFHATHVALENSKITGDQANSTKHLILHPMRKTADGTKVADVIEKAREYTVELVGKDTTLPPAIRESAVLLTFDWAAIWTWILANLPTILEFIAQLLVLFTEEA